MSRTKCNECGANRGVATYNEGSHCYACGFHTYNRILLKTLKNDNYKIVLDSLPRNKPYTLNKQSIEYLKKYYLTNKQIMDHRIYWADDINRLIFPINYETGWARGLNNEKNKWLFLGNKKLFYFLFKQKQFNNRDNLVIVEDPISGIRVADFASVLVLGGTKIKKSMESLILSYKRLTIWLDGDMAGKNGALSIYNKYKLFKPMKIIQTKKDPKCYNSFMIRKYLNDFV